MSRLPRFIAWCAFGVATFASDASAQPSFQEFDVEAVAGYARFLDAERSGHLAAGAAARWHPTRHLALGPEVLYLMGPLDDRKLIVTGDLTGNFLPDRRITPFLRVGLGMVRRYYQDLWASNDLAFRAGGGLKISMGPATYMTAEFRVGGDLAITGSQSQATHNSVTFAVGYSPRSR